VSRRLPALPRRLVSLSSSPVSALVCPTRPFRPSQCRVVPGLNSTSQAQRQPGSTLVLFHVQTNRHFVPDLPVHSDCSCRDVAVLTPGQLSPTARVHPRTCPDRKRAHPCLSDMPWSLLDSPGHTGTTCHSLSLTKLRTAPVAPSLADLPCPCRVKAQAHRQAVPSHSITYHADCLLPRRCRAMVPPSHSSPHRPA
jgi:hypothetical protein